MTAVGWLRVYANVSWSARQRERQVLGKAIGSGKTRSRPEADAGTGRLKCAWRNHRSMISSARSNTDCGIFRPRAFAVFILITSSNFVGCATGRSAGLVPLRILAT